jgi:hypothetical protein
MIHLLNYLKFLGSRAGEYLTHRVVPEKKGKGKDLAVITHSVLEEFGSCESLEAVLMDNTATNTGHIGGLHVCLEKLLGRKLHLIGCFLHLNELPLRHLIQKLDGKTISGNKFAGDVGMQLDAEDLYRRDLVHFEPIPVPLGKRIIVQNTIKGRVSSRKCDIYLNFKILNNPKIFKPLRC